MICCERRSEKYVRNKLLEFVMNVIFIFDVEMNCFPPWKTTFYLFGVILIFHLDLPVSCPPSRHPSSPLLISPIGADLISF